MNWRDILKVESDEEKMAGAVTTSSSPALFNISYGKKRKKDGEEEED